MSTNNKNILKSEDKRLQSSTEALQNMKTIKVSVSQAHDSAPNLSPKTNEISLSYIQ